MHFLNFRDESRKEYGTKQPSADSCLNNEQLKIGAILRIADAVEDVAKDYRQLQKEHDRLSQAYRRQGQYLEMSQRSNSALRGVITKLKRKLAIEGK